MLERLSLPMWDALTEEEAREAVRFVEERHPRARFVRFEDHAQADQRHRVAVFEVDGVEMVLVPGGRATLGFDVELLNDTAQQAWSSSFKEEGHAAQQIVGGPNVGQAPPDEMVTWLKGTTTPLREVELEPFLLERTSPAVEEDRRESHDGDGDPHARIAEAVVAQGFRLPTSDEWEWAVSGGTHAVFRWGNVWPVDTHVYDGGRFDEHGAPNAFGLRFSTDPYQSEVVDDPEELRGGDGGTMVCGEVGPMAWTSFASSFRKRLELSDDREIWFENVHPRRALSVLPRESDAVIRHYERPSPLESAAMAAHVLREALEDLEGLVLDEEERGELANEIGDLDALVGAHRDDVDVQTLAAHAYRMLGLFDEAEAVLRRLIMHEDTWRSWVTLASVFHARGDIERAIAAHDTAAERSPEAGASHDAAALLAQAGRFAEAADRYERFAAKHPDQGWARAQALYTRFKASGDPAVARLLVEIASGPAKGVDWIAELADQVSPGWRKKAPKKMAAAKKSSTKKAAAKRATKTKKPPSKKAPSKKAPSKKAPSKKAPSKKAPSKKAPKTRAKKPLAKKRSR